MRTTLTLDDDVAATLEELARRKRVSFKEIVNSVLRKGLASPRHTSKSDEPYRIATFRSAFRPGVDPLRLSQLSDELEVREFGEPSR